MWGDRRLVRPDRFSCHMVGVPFSTDSDSQDDGPQERCMERSTKAAQKQKEAAENQAAETSDTLLPLLDLLDLLDAPLKKLIGAAKKRGYVTHDQINSVAEDVDSE